MNKILAIAVCALACVSFSGGYFVNDAVRSSEEQTPEPVDGCIEKIIWSCKLDFNRSVFTIVGDCSLAGPSDDPQATMLLSTVGAYRSDSVKIYDGMRLFYAGVGSNFDTDSVVLECPHGRHFVEVVTDLQPWM